MLYIIIDMPSIHYKYITNQLDVLELNSIHIYEESKS